MQKKGFCAACGRRWEWAMEGETKRWIRPVDVRESSDLCTCQVFWVAWKAAPGPTDEERYQQAVRAAGHGPMEQTEAGRRYLRAL